MGENYTYYNKINTLIRMIKDFMGIGTIFILCVLLNVF